MKREIKKCDICGEPFWIKSLDDNVCNDCIITANGKEIITPSGSNSYDDHIPPTVGKGDCMTANL